MLTSRAVRWLLIAWAVLWGFDRAIFWLTEGAWFGSVGQGAWFWTRFATELGLFWATFGLELGSAALLMRLAARPFGRDSVSTETALPRALERLEPVRRGATRVAWGVLLVGAWLVARGVAASWPLVLAGTARVEGDFETVWQLPLLHALLGALWQWSLLLLGAVAFAGVLRALPQLATRQPQTPLRLWRALGALGALVLVTRGASYALEIAENLASDGTTGRELWLGAPLGALGIALCVWAALWCLRRPGFKRMGIAVVLALFAPRAVGVLLAPLGLILPAPANLTARDLAATRAGWGLDNAPAIAASAPPLSAHWPLWNETALLGVARGEHGRYKNQVTDWRAAFVSGAPAIVVGVPAALEGWGSRHEAQPESELAWLALDAQANAQGVAPETVGAPLPLRSFYGIEGRPLAGNAALNAGVPFGNWGWKFAWLWRLRDPLLLLDGANAGRLLVFRGARESVEKLAPFLTWDAPTLHMTPDGARWEIVGYAKSVYFRGARAADADPFAGFNAATPAVRALVDPQSGRVTFENWNENWGAGWAKVLGASAGQGPLETPLLDGARAQMARQIGATGVLDEPVWTWANGRARQLRRATNFPAGLDARLAQLDGAASHDWNSADGKTLEKGDAMVWPAARAPGGFWVGRPYYGVVRNNGVVREARLWRVALTGVAASSPLAAGDDARAAMLAFDLQNAPAKPRGPIAADVKALALEALRAQKAAQKALTQSNWKEWEKQNEREKQLLEELASR